MSHEYQVHHLVSELVSLLGVQETSGVDSYVDILLKNRTPYVTTQVSAHNAKRKIAAFSSDGAEFLKKYDELKLRQTRELDPLVYLLSKIAEDDELCQFLRERCPPVPDPKPEPVSDVRVLDVVEGQSVPLPSKGAVLTGEELDSLRGKLESVTTTLVEQDLEKRKRREMKLAANFPKLPTWLTERPYLTSDYVASSLRLPLSVSLGSLPVAMQEQAVIEDLLFLMMGVDGRYIRAEVLEDDKLVRSFSTDKNLNVSLLALLNRILPVCSHYSVVRRFVEDRSKFIHGMVNQALCAAMRGVLREFLVVVAQLEHQFRGDQLSLQKLWYYVQPCIRSLEILARIALSVCRGSCRGGKTLTNLHSFTAGYTGEERAQELCLHLTRAACRPYFETLGQWIHRGIVNDPYHEFMIEQHELIQKDRLHVEYNDAYWEKRYTVVQVNIPSFLEQVTEKVLRTGKYLNVIRECGSEVVVPEVAEIGYTVQERHYVEQIERAYTHASHELLELMIQGHDLLGHLRSIKHYFLLDQGDLFVHFMDMAGEELRRPMTEIPPSRLTSLLELALRTSLVDSDPYKDNLRPLLVPYDLVTQLFYIMAIQPEGVGPDAYPPTPILRPDPDTINLTGVDAFSLDYTVAWPLSLVVSRKCLFKYQMLFRHLFGCKHVERELCAAWSSHKAARRQRHRWCSSAFALLQRMLNLVQNLQYYMTFEVLEPKWLGLEQTLRSVETIDDVLAAHNDFLDQCLRDCMLSSREVLKAISRLLGVCATFAAHMKKVGAAAEVAEVIRPARGTRSTETPTKTRERSRLLSEDFDELVVEDSFEETVEKFDANFTRDIVFMLEKLYALNTHTVGSMVSRLDFNGYYQKRVKTERHSFTV